MSYLFGGLTHAPVSGTSVGWVSTPFFRFESYNARLKDVLLDDGLNMRSKGEEHGLFLAHTYYYA
jgi:hypothetical protein